MAPTGDSTVSLLKFVGTVSLGLLTFVGTVSLGLLTGVSYNVSTIMLPGLLRLPSSNSAFQAVSSLQTGLRKHILTLTTLASAPLFLSFAFSPSGSRHPYLLYTSVLAALSAAAPRLLTMSGMYPTARPHGVKKSSRRGKNKMESSYEVLGDAHSEGMSEEEVEDLNGEEVRAEVETLTRGYMARTGLAACGFVLAVVGIWGDGAPDEVWWMVEN
ncbi:hypothetical protein L249_6879 [Ophiocordyceps polyrhachis-furcata BCC 54312]|uniref:Autophagy-related protein 33 n=1 Tax=Ophiocordyceps polyrhachis-furcata BCC 54312 TaxID=1330021 RepID=A0A367LJG5_9HYPO|nr:hypothetical protein L249_6879 [Ophiocordyceps polyrhachis-furcata BCC 54312]